MRKRVFAGLLAAMILLTMSGCGSKDEDKDSQVKNPSQVEGSIDGDESGDQGETEDGDQSVESGNQGGIENGTGGSAAKPGPGSTSKPGAGNAASKPGAGNSGSALSGSLEDIMGSVYSGLKDMPNCSITEVTADNAQYYLGVTDIPYVRAIASEPMMSSVAHSVVLLELKDGSDIKAAKKKIKENVDGRKWICVGVEPENIEVDNIGNYVLLVMDEQSGSIMKQFKSLAK